MKVEGNMTACIHHWKKQSSQEELGLWEVAQKEWSGYLSRGRRDEEAWKHEVMEGLDSHCKEISSVRWEHRRAGFWGSIFGFTFHLYSARNKSRGSVHPDRNSTIELYTYLCFEFQNCYLRRKQSRAQARRLQKLATPEGWWQWNWWEWAETDSEWKGACLLMDCIAHME